jgi:hypothetical protein
MNITKHARKRYTERIKGITTKDEVAYYMNNNEQIITESILKMFEHSTRTWRGQLGDNVTRNYYLASDIVLVTNTDDSAIVTLYKVDFGFPAETNHKVVNDLIEKIRVLEEYNEEELGKAMEDEKKLEFEVYHDNLELEILQKQIEDVKNRIKAKQEMIKVHKNKTSSIENEIKKYALMLCNSIDYKVDLPCL